MMYGHTNMNFSQTFLYNLSVAPSRIFFGVLPIEDGTDRLPRNVGTELPLYVLYNPKRAQSSFTMRRKPEIIYFCVFFMISKSPN